MVLMSDTGGGHRASAEALKAGFDILYGDKYKVTPPTQQARLGRLRKDT